MWTFSIRSVVRDAERQLSAKVLNLIMQQLLPHPDGSGRKDLSILIHTAGVNVTCKDRRMIPYIFQITA